MRGSDAARHLQARVAAGQVGEAGREPAERDPPRGAGVGGHHLVGVEAGQLGDLGQVGAVVDDRDLDDRALQRGHGVHLQLEDGAAERGEVGAGLDRDHHRARRRHHVEHVRPLGRRGPRRPARAPRRGPPPPRAARRRRMGQHRRPPAQTKARSSHPGARRPSRTAGAIATAPGESPCTHADSARTAHVASRRRRSPRRRRPSAPPAAPTSAGSLQERARLAPRHQRALRGVAAVDEELAAPRAAPPSPPPRAAGSRAARAPAGRRRRPGPRRPLPAPAPRGGRPCCRARRAA